jgi:hypothetical protein
VLLESISLTGSNGFDSNSSRWELKSLARFPR